MSFLSGFTRGAAAGAAGTTALNAVTYLDMAVRGRPSSDTPSQLVEKTADEVGVDIPGSGDTRDNRLAGMGPLVGTGVGVIVGAIAGVIHDPFARRGRMLPAPLSVLLIGAAAMALSDVPLKIAGLSDPKEWSGKDWISDIIPHLTYGVVTYGTLRATDPDSTK